MPESNNKTDQDLVDEFLKAAKKIKDNPQKFAGLCIATGIEIFTRLETIAKETLNQKLRDFLDV